MSSQARSVLVTGAAGGIGRAVVRRLHGAGWTVLGTDLVAAPQELPVARWVTADLATAAGRAEIAGHAGASLSGFVHCAGVFHTDGLGAIDEGAWDRVFAVNAKAPVLLFQAVADRMTGGSAVFVASIAALRATPGHLIYAASKAALRSLAASLAMALAARNVRVNCVCPGLIDTQMTDAANAELAARRGVAAASMAVERAAAIPAGRAGAPDEVAGAVAFLLSDEAAYISGTTLTVAGGLLAGSA